MGVRNPNSTNYVHPDEPNLLNLHKSMEYDEAGIPHVRVRLGTDNITITGNVNVIDNVRINNTEDQSIPVHLTDDPITVNQGTNPWIISGNITNTPNVHITNTPDVTGNIIITSLPAITGNVNANVSGNVVITSGNVNSNVSGNVVITSGNINSNVSGNVVVTSGNINANVSGNVVVTSGNITVAGNVNANVSGNVVVTSGNINSNVSGNVVITSGNVNSNVSGNVVITSGNVNANVSGNVVITSGNVNSNVSGNVVVTSGNISANVSGNVNANVSGNVVVTSGNVNASVSGNVVVTSGNINANVTQGTSPWVVTGNVVMTTDANIPPAVYFADTVQMDTTDRLRTSVIGQQWWYVPSVDKDGDLRIQEAFQGTGASSTFIQNLASVCLTSGLVYDANPTLTGSTIRASRRRHKTRPGVSTEWIGIVNWDGLQNNVVKRIGLFTAYNGIFIEARSDGIYAVVRRRLTDGTLVETAKKHTEWSLDQMDGAGPSKYNWQLPNITANVTSVYAKNTVAIAGDGNVYQVVYQMPAGQESIIPVGKKVTLTGLTPTTFNGTGLVTAIDTVNHRVTVAYVVDPGNYVSSSSAKMTNTAFHAIHSYWFDLSGSRIGRVRFGMYTDHGKVCVHEYTSGEIGTQVFSAPALMDRKEIINVGQPVDFLPSMTVGGSAVTIETSAEINPGFGVARTATAITFNKNSQVGSEFAILGVGLRIGEPYQRADLQVNKLQIVDLGNLNPQNAGIFQYRLVLNPTVTGTVTTTNVGKASRQLTYAQGSTATGGIELIAGYAQGTFTGDVTTALNFLNMGSNIAYTDSDVVVLLIKLLVGGTDNSSVMGTINYTEDL